MQDAARAYRQKRDPKRTPEPFGGKAGDALRFVVQRHAARSLHYDFRLERDGVLAELGRAEGRAAGAGERHLAVHVEDHPLDYGDFEGEIPAGQYGAGTVEIWDRGTYELVEEKKDGGLTVRLHGERLEGLWTLVPAHLDGKEKNWLLLRKDARRRGAATTRRCSPRATDVAAGGEGWAFEPKWDGFRALAASTAATPRFRSRNDNDLTRALRRGGPRARPSGALALRRARRRDLRARRDRAARASGCCSRAPARSSSSPSTCSSSTASRWSTAPTRAARGARAARSTLASRRPASRRRSTTAPRSRARRARARARRGRRQADATRPTGPGRRSTDWRKLKLKQRQELVIAGFTRGQGRRASGIGALVLGVHDADGLRYAGNVGTGFTDRELDRLEALLQPLRGPTTPFAEEPKMPKVAPRRRDLGRADARRRDRVRRVDARRPAARARLPRPARRQAALTRWSREHVPMPSEIRRGARVLKLSNLDKPFWPDEGITKGDLLAYYRDVAPVLVPHLRDRPFTMKRYPDGWQGKYFFQKDAPSHMPDWIPARAVPGLDARRREAHHRLPARQRRARAVVDGQHGLHRHERVDVARRPPDRPDWVIFDLDPSDDVGFPEVIEVALLVKQLLDLARARELPEDERLARDPRARPDRAAARLRRRRGRSPAIVAGALARAHPGARDDRVDEAQAPRRARRREPERPRQDDRRRSTRCARAPGRPSRRRSRGTRCARASTRRAFTMDEVRARIARHGDLFAPVLDAASVARGGAALARRLRQRLATSAGSRLEPLGVPEARQLGDVAAEEERRRPVGDDAELAAQERQRVEVVRARDEPAEEARERGRPSRRRCPCSGRASRPGRACGSRTAAARR